MTELVELDRLESTVNLIHFQSTEHLEKIVKDRLFYFQNARKYSHEVKIISIDSEFYAADSIGVFCFSHDMKAVFNAEMWCRFGTKAGLKSVCIGFWESGAEGVANTSGIKEHAIELAMRNRRKMINNNHKMSEPVYVGRASYLEKAELNNYKNLPPCTKDMLDKAEEIMLLTFEPNCLSYESEDRFIILDCSDFRDVPYISRFIPRPKLIILGPEVDDAELDQYVEDYRNQVVSIWRACIQTDGTVTIRRIWN